MSLNKFCAYNFRYIKLIFMVVTMSKLLEFIEKPWSRTTKCFLCVITLLFYINKQLIKQSHLVHFVFVHITLLSCIYRSLS